MNTNTGKAKNWMKVGGTKNESGSNHFNPYWRCVIVAFVFISFPANREDIKEARR